MRGLSYLRNAAQIVGSRALALPVQAPHLRVPDLHIPTTRPRVLLDTSPKPLNLRSPVAIRLVHETHAQIRKIRNTLHCLQIFYAMRSSDPEMCIEGDVSIRSFLSPKKHAALVV